MIFLFTGWSSVNLLLVFNVDGYSHLGAGTTRPGPAGSLLRRARVFRRPGPA